MTRDELKDRRYWLEEQRDILEMTNRTKEESKRLERIKYRLEVVNLMLGF